MAIFNIAGLIYGDRKLSFPVYLKGWVSVCLSVTRLIELARLQFNKLKKYRISLLAVACMSLKLRRREGGLIGNV